MVSLFVYRKAVGHSEFFFNFRVLVGQNLEACMFSRGGGYIWYILPFTSQYVAMTYNLFMP